jgi:phosphate/sulfate permease
MMDTITEMASVTARVLAEEACCGQYKWMTIAAVIFGFFMAFGIGANDVANAFATSVSAKSITLKQAVLIAAICEFLGAMLLGASVTSTIRKGIIDGDMYTDEPDVLMYGMLAALVSASIMMMIANFLALPISTTHTIIASIVGFSLAAKGFQSVIWKTVGLIFVSWVAAPAITGVFGALFFWIIRRFVLRSENPYKRCVAIYPMTIFLAVGLDIFMVLYKAGKNNAQIKEWGLKFQLPAAFGISAVLAVVFYFAIQPLLERRIAAKFDKEDGDGDVESGPDASPEKVEEQAVDETVKELSCNGSSKGSAADEVVVDDYNKDQENAEASSDGKKSKRKSLMRMASQSFQKLGDATINRDIEAEAFAMSKNTQEMWESGENFDPKAEMMFSYLQVLTACLLSFAHGANDVANAIAPLSAVLLIYETGHISSKAPVQKWVLALGGAGIVFGLALYGYKLIISLGYRMVKVSPARGFAIELSAATVVVVASFLGIPISTTQCKVGGTTAVGMFDGKKGVDPWFLFKVVMGWVLTFFGVCILNAGIFAFGYYAPSANGFA